MLLSFFTRTIRRRLVVSFGIMLALVVVAGIAGALGLLTLHNTLEQVLGYTFRAGNEIAGIQSQVLDLQRLEALYLANYARVGLESARRNYVTPALEQADRLLENFDALAVTLEQAGLPDQIQPVMVLRGSVDTYSEWLESLASGMEKRGVETEGYVGDLRRLMSNMLAVVEENDVHELLDVLYTLQIAERNYLLTRQLTQLTAVRRQSGVLQSQVIASNLSSEEEQRLSSLGDQYLGTFEVLVDQEAENDSAIRFNQNNLNLISRRLDAIEQTIRESVAAAQMTIFERVDQVLAALALTVVAAIVMGAALAYGITRSITWPLAHIDQITRQIARGDFSRRVAVSQQDEIGDLADTFNVMADRVEGMIAAEQESRQHLESAITGYVSFAQQIASGDLSVRLALDPDSEETSAKADLYRLGWTLNAMVASLSELTHQVRAAAMQVSSGAAEILAASTQQMASVTEQGAAVTQTMATVEEVRTTVNQTADRAQAVATASQNALVVSRRGEESVASTVAGMQTIRDRVTDIATTILALSERTQQIGEIIATVDEIADQSRLLALNASIEAARAGEEGRGFAVVAMEVRQLAEQSQEATGRISGILQEIQAATNTAVMVTEEGSKGADAGAALVRQAGEVIRDLATTIENTVQAATQIAASTRQQVNGIDQLVAAMGAIRQASAEAAASSRQAEASAQSLNEVARHMEDTVSLYRV